jgi:hypothetical protein
MRDLIAVFNKSYHDALNKHMKTYPNTSLKHDGFLIHTEYVPVDTNPNEFNVELYGEIGELECRIVFDTDPSYYPDHNLFAVLLNPNENAKILFGDIFEKEPKVRIVSPIWEKLSVLIKASFADVDSDNFLGHTRKLVYTPIECYKIVSTDQKFWLYFYSSSDYRCPVDFPCRKITKEVTDDNGGSHTIEYEEPILNLLMETILLFNSNSII